MVVKKITEELSKRYCSILAQRYCHYYNMAEVQDIEAQVRNLNVEEDSDSDSEKPEERGSGERSYDERPSEEPEDSLLNLEGREWNAYFTRFGLPSRICKISEEVGITWGLLIVPRKDGLFDIYISDAIPKQYYWGVQSVNPKFLSHFCFGPSGIIPRQEMKFYYFGRDFGITTWCRRVKLENPDKESLQDRQSYVMSWLCRHCSGWDRDEKVYKLPPGTWYTNPKDLKPVKGRMEVRILHR